MTFTTDWRGSIVHWPDLFAELDLVGHRDLRFLEVGCFEGRTTLWLLAHVLTDPTSLVTVIDPFGHDGQRERFNRNVMPYLEAGKVRIWPYPSGAVLRGKLGVFDLFDFVYVDGDHSAAAVLADAVLVWPAVKPGGVVVFDDYDWPGMPPLDSPGIAVDAFVACYEREIARAERSGRDQFLVQKAAA